MTAKLTPKRERSPGPWRRQGRTVCDAEGFTIFQATGHFEYRYHPNLDLAAKAPEMAEREERIAELLRELADDLEAELEHHYGKTLEYPSEKRRYERDIKPVREARALLKELDG